MFWSKPNKNIENKVVEETSDVLSNEQFEVELDSLISKRNKLMNEPHFSAVIRDKYDEVKGHSLIFLQNIYSMEQLILKKLHHVLTMMRLSLVPEITRQKSVGISIRLNAFMNLVLIKVITLAKTITNILQLNTTLRITSIL